METKTKKSVNTTHSNSSGKELLKYYEFSKKMKKLNFILGDLDNYEFPLNRKAVKEVDKYYKNNLINPKQDKEYTKKYISDFKKLASKLECKYMSDIGSDFNSYNRVHIFRDLQCQALNIKREDLNRLLSMFKDKNTLTLSYDKLSIRLLAYYSKDKKLNDLLKHCDDTYEDFYSHLAAIIFDDTYENCLEIKLYTCYNEVREGVKPITQYTLPNEQGNDRRKIAKQVMLYEIYRKVPDVNYKESFLKYVEIFENHFSELKSWVNKMLKYNKPYIQDVFGNIFVFKNSYLENEKFPYSICALINLIESSIHNLFLLELIKSHTVNIRLPLQHNFIVDIIDYNKEDNLSFYTKSGELFIIFEELFKEYNLKLNIEN